MATRSSITVKLPDGRFNGVYCHNDGYPSGVGRMLFLRYNTFEAALSLVALGHLSQVMWDCEPHPSDAHSFDTPTREVTVAYHRDRGETLTVVGGKSWKSVTDRIDSEYDYLFEDGVWYVKRSGMAKRPVENFRDGMGNWHDLLVK